MSSISLNKNKISSYAGNIFLCIIAATLAIAPFFRGMYFEQNQFIMYFVTFSVGIFYSIYSIWAGKKIKLNLADIALMFVLVMYYVSAFWAIDTRQAISETLKYSNCFVFYMIIKNEVTNSKKGPLHLVLFIELITAVIAFVGLLAAMGANLPGAFSLAEGWINSTLQYHNAFGAVSLAGLCIAIAVTPVFTKMYSRITNSVLSTILLYGLFFSNSRGAWVMAPIVLLILLVFMFKDNLFEYITSVLSIVAGAVFLNGFWTGVLDENWFESATFLVSSIVLSVVVSLIAHKISQVLKKKNFNIKKWFIVIIAVLIVLVVLLSLLAPSIISKIIPENILSRLKDISFTTGTVTERFVFYKDAMNIIGDYPVFGAGGGSWNALYKVFASYNYATSEPHSFVIKTIVEIGFIGLIALLFALGFIFISAIKRLKNNDNNIAVIASVSAIAAILLHSLIDFDLSISAVLLIVVAFVAILSSLIDAKEFELTSILRYVAIAIFSVALVMTFMLNLAQINAKKGQEMYNTNPKNSFVYFDRAVKLDPTNSVYRTNLITVLVQQNDKDVDYNETNEIIAKACQYDRYDFDLNFYASRYYQITKDYKSALYHTDAMVKLRPYDAPTINSSIILYTNIRVLAGKAGDVEYAEKANNKVIELAESVEEKNKQLESFGQDTIELDQNSQMYYNAAISIRDSE